MGGVAVVPNTNVLPASTVSKLALLLSGNKAALGDGGAPPDQGTNPSSVMPTMAAPTSPLAYKPAMAAAPVAPEAAPAPAAAVSPMAYKPLPAAPTAPTTDMAARQKLAEAVAKDSQRTDPNDPNAKAKWYDRLFGGMATFGAAMQHNPNAVQIGQDIVGRRYQQAENQREGRLDSDRSALGQFDQNTSQAEKDYQRQRDVFADQIKAAQEERAQKSETALTNERNSKANRQDYLSMSPKERAAQVADLENTAGLKFNDTQKQDFILTGKIPNAANKPSLGETFKQREEEGAAAGLKGDELKYYKINGKLREPNPDAEARLADARLRHEDSEADRAQREDDSNFNKSQSRIEQYNKQKADIVQREKDAYAKLETDSRDKKTGAIIDPTTLENRKAELQKSFKAEYDALGGPPADTPARNARSAPAAKAAPAAAPAKAAPADEERIPVVSPDGKTRGSVPKSQLSIALGEGYKQVKQ